MCPGELALAEQRALREFWFAQRGEPIHQLLWGNVLDVVTFDEAWGTESVYIAKQRQFDISRIPCNDRVALFEGVTCNGVEFSDILEQWVAEFDGLRIEVPMQRVWDARRDNGVCAVALPLDVLRLVSKGIWTHFCGGGQLPSKRRSNMSKFRAGKEAGHSNSTSIYRASRRQRETNPCDECYVDKNMHVR